jgi:hypothetical protein
MEAEKSKTGDDNLGFSPGMYPKVDSNGNATEEGPPGESRFQKSSKVCLYPEAYGVGCPKG